MLILKEKTIKIQEMVENIANYSKHICKCSRSMFARQPDVCFYIVNKAVKHNLIKGLD